MEIHNTIIVYIHKSLLYNCIDTVKLCGNEVPKALAIELKVDIHKKMIVGIFYRSPNSSEENNNNINKCMKKLCDLESNQVIFIGDFNYPDINWHSCTSKRLLLDTACQITNSWQGDI